MQVPQGGYTSPTDPGGGGGYNYNFPPTSMPDTSAALMAANLAAARGLQPPMAAGQLPSYTPNADPTNTRRGSAAPSGFSWGNRNWGTNDFSAFSRYLASRGVSIGEWARAHPAAFATFNVDPRIKQLIAQTGMGAPGGMPHA